MPRVSLVIPTFDRPDPLRDCLAALAVDFPLDAETIVVDDGGSHDLVGVVAPFVVPLRLRLFRCDNGGPAAARNQGIAVANGDVIAFTDDDCRPRPGWLAALAAGVVASPPRAVGGTTLNGLPRNAYADASQLVLDLLSRHDRALVGRERLLSSNNFAFPTEALCRLGGFDEQYRTAEDRELCRRWSRAGYDLARVPSAVVDHDPRLGLASFTRKFFAYGCGAARFHETGTDGGLRESSRFHLRLPALLLPELRRRGAMRGAAVVALLVLWELANLAGFAWERARAVRVAALARARAEPL
jgi:GT2 family glycosyltransferase